MFRLDIKLYLSECLFEGSALDGLQEILLKHAPQWTSGIHVWQYRGEKNLIDMSRPGALATEVRSNALKRIPLSERIAKATGSFKSTRRLGNEELRGAEPSLILVMLLDDSVFRRISDHWFWGNSIAFQICRKRVDGIDAVEWASNVLEEACSELSPDFAHAEMMEEYGSKNLSTEGGGLQAIGIDISRYLPGVYWSNFFGQKYCDFIGRNKLLTAPTYKISEVGNGILAKVSERPQDWDTLEYKDRVDRFLSHVGDEYFFDRCNPDKPTKSPFNLSPLPPHDPSKDIQVLHLGGGKYEPLNPEIRKALGKGPIDPEDLKRLGLPPDWKPPGHGQ